MFVAFAVRFVSGGLSVQVLLLKDLGLKLRSSGFRRVDGKVLFGFRGLGGSWVSC